MKKENIHILEQLKRGLLIALILAVVGEMVFFPSLANFYGCIMAIVAYLVFSYFLNEKYIIQYSFAFLMYMSMFMYRYLPVIATLAEGKPITFGLVFPFETFLYETLLFLISSLAFYVACKVCRQGKYNVIQRNLIKFNFFQTTPSILWGIGLIGSIIRLYNFSASDVDYGDVGGKFLIGLTYLMYAPLCLFFPSLLNFKYSNRKILWFYAAFIFIINIASNSRESIIMPIATVLILFFLFAVKKNINVADYITPRRLVITILSLYILLNLLSNVSLAMLYTRDIRKDVTKMELFEKTINTLKDASLMERLKLNKKKKQKKLTSYHAGWTEYYVDNFMLDRYANIRITDQTIYYAKKRGYANQQMQKNFKENLLTKLPTPLLRIFGFSIDKSKLEFSRGDFLYGRAFGGYRVTSHVGDGLATFSFWYFPFQFIAFFLVFILLNSFVLNSAKAISYAPFALMSAFDILGMFRNANGITADISYIIRGYWQGVVTYLIIFFIVRQTLMLINPKYVLAKTIIKDT